MTSNHGSSFLSPRLSTADNQGDAGTLTEHHPPSSDGADSGLGLATVGSHPETAPPTRPPTPQPVDRPREHVDIPAAAAADGEYILRLRGDSMTGAGMLDGDYLVVKPADTAIDGQIVVAMVGQEMTVKRWRLDQDGQPWLEPANPELEPIRGDVRVVGRVVGLFRTVTPPSHEKDS